LVLAVVAVLAVSLTAASTASAVSTFTVRADTAYNSVDRKDKNVYCPEASQRVGGGAKIVDARKFVKLETSRPINSGWRGVAVENKHETGKSWKLVVKVVCEGAPIG
jgi:hypothetical protein